MVSRHSVVFVYSQYGNPENILGFVGKLLIQRIFGSFGV